MTILRKNQRTPLKAEELKRLRMHLDLSGDNTPEIQRAWATYYRANDESDKAIEALNKGANDDPTLLLMIAQLQGELDLTEERSATLDKAALQFEELVKKYPKSSRVRFWLANTMEQQKRFDEAAEVLVKGLEENDDGAMREANAAFFTRQHDREKTGKNRLGRRLNYLFGALAANPNYMPIYERLIQLANEKDFNNNKVDQIIGKLNGLIAEGRPNPMAHFALSTILWEQKEFDKSTNHLEMAYKIEPKFDVVLNNLAWVLAHQDVPNLERALELAKQAVQSSPQDGRYHDTLGTVYLKLGQFTDAAAEFELAMPSVDDKIAVRKKLVTVYTNLDMLEQAKLQEEKIEASNK